MKQGSGQKGFSILIVAIAILVLGGVGLAGWYTWSKHQGETEKLSDKSVSKTPQKDAQTKSQATQADPSEGGKFFVIKEWGVRFALQSDLQGKITYLLGEALTDPDGDQLQAAKVLIKSDPSAGNDCTIVKTVQGDFIESGAQLLRSEKDKPFNTQRYRWTFKDNILKDDRYSYHLNYVTPDCVAPSTAGQIEELQLAAERLLKIQQ
jgi:hypothetical protein